VASISGVLSVGGPAAAFVMARSFNWGNPISKADGAASQSQTKPLPRAASSPPTSG
jgi:hypothetical protein